MCKQRILFYAEDEDVLEVDTLAEFAAEDMETTDVSHIHAMDGGRRSRSLRVLGIIQDKEVSVCRKR